MEELVVSKKTLHEMMYESLVRSAKLMPSDIKAALERDLKQETNELARKHIEAMLGGADMCAESDGVLCADTGWPLYWVRMGENVRLEGGFSTLYSMAKQAATEATNNDRIRPNMVHPLTREYYPGNSGPYMPRVEIQFDPRIDFLEVVGIAKGGGSELFGTFYTIIAPADRHQGVIKFVLDCLREATFAGKACGPNIVGVGIGGTADLAMHIAKEAALLRPVGSRHPDPAMAKMETDLLEAARYLNRGPMGTGGRTGALDVHVEFAATHSGTLPVAFQTQCCITRRAVAHYGGAKIEYSDVPNWDYR
ncbi:MAG: fumarate hydratase [Chloroflexi bacterium]|nr:fumarate hydratase [Chloroflexota bacterium]